jgi:hypothetical protein
VTDQIRDVVTLSSRVLAAAGQGDLLRGTPPAGRRSSHHHHSGNDPRYAAFGGLRGLPAPR